MPWIAGSCVLVALIGTIVACRVFKVCKVDISEEELKKVEEQEQYEMMSQGSGSFVSSGANVGI
jgi:hypothetical protein